MSVAKRKREEEKDKFEKTNNSINKYFSNGPVAAAPKPKVRKFRDADYRRMLIVVAARCYR